MFQASNLRVTGDEFQSNDLYSSVFFWLAAVLICLDHGWHLIVFKFLFSHSGRGSKGNLNILIKRRFFCPVGLFRIIVTQMHIEL